MQSSPYQTDIIKAVQQRLRAKKKKGLIIEALAGSGKSTMIWLICQQLQSEGFSPQEVSAVVFGKKNKEDLQKKVELYVGRDWGAVVRTLHSLCYGIYRDALNVSHNRVTNESGKYIKIAQEFGFFPLKDEQGKVETPGTLLEGAIFSEKDFIDLIDRIRLYCLNANYENVKYLVELYQLGIKDIELVAAAAEYCLSEGLKVATNRRYWIDMTDMVWVPWAMRNDSRFNAAIAGRRDSLKFLLLDEAQDTDLLQIEVLSLLVNPSQSFLTAVGDRNQACYFFRGALNDGMDRIQKRFQGENFPLPVCYRCGTSHLELVREVFPNIAIQPRSDAPVGEIRVVLNRDFPRIFDLKHLSYMGVCRKNAPLIKAAIQLLAAGKPAKIKDRNIGGRLVTRVKDICQKQRVKYSPKTFIRVSVEYESAQRKRLQDFPNSENQILDLTDMLEAIRALFQAYEPSTFKAWERIVERIFDESGYSPISLYTIHTGKGGEGQVSFILYPEDLPLIHPKQVEEERQQEDHLLYVALTRTLADGAEGSGILYLVCREAGSEEEDDGEVRDRRAKVKWPEWLPKKYRSLWKWDESSQPEPDEDGTIEVEASAIAPTSDAETVDRLQSEVAETSEILEKPTGIRWISPAAITLDAGTQSRAGMNEAAIAEYAAAMNDELWQWEREPLPILFWDGDRLYPGDGHHRILAAASIEGGIDICCEIREGTARDARFFSCGANRFHGLQRSNADKRNQVALLLQDSEWQQLSDRAIAEHCGVSAPFVGKVRVELTESSTVKPSNKRVDRKGRQIDTTNIGTKPKSVTLPDVAAIAPQVTATATESLLKPSAVGVLETAFSEDQKQEQAQIDRATQIKAEITTLKARLATLEAELAALWA